MINHRTLTELLVGDRDARVIYGRDSKGVERSSIVWNRQSMTADQQMAEFDHRLKQLEQ